MQFTTGVEECTYAENHGVPFRPIPHTRPDPTRRDPTLRDVTRFDLTRLDSTRLVPTRLDSTRFHSIRRDVLRLDSTRHIPVFHIYIYSGAVFQPDVRFAIDDHTTELHAIQVISSPMVAVSTAMVGVFFG